MNTEVKICINCDETKPLTEFYKSSKSKDGHQNMCKECQRMKDKIGKRWAQRTFYSLNLNEQDY
jgi:hypothetical protein